MITSVGCASTPTSASSRIGMDNPAPNPELMRSLGRLVKGLSALFWGLPLTLLVCFHTLRMEGFKNFGIVPPIACTGLLFYGLLLLGDFQRQERVWRNALDIARVLALINVGLSPFLYWLNRMPSNSWFLNMVLVFTFSALLFLASLNVVLRRLAAMLPDEALRLETRQFTALNLNLLFSTVLIEALAVALKFIPHLPRAFGVVAEMIERFSFWFLVLLVLLPLAMTMALIWKTKEVILENVFHSHSAP